MPPHEAAPIPGEACEVLATSFGELQGLMRFGAGPASEVSSLSRTGSRIEWEGCVTPPQKLKF